MFYLEFLPVFLFSEEFRCAGVVELVDAPDSKSGISNDVSVRLRPPAPNIRISTNLEAP